MKDKNIIDIKNIDNKERIKIYKTVDGIDLKLKVFYPENWTNNDRRAAIIFFFGSGWKNGDKKQFSPQCEYFASLGLVAMTADYRVKQKHNTTPLESIEDAKTAIYWIRKNYNILGIDQEKIVASGGSAGG